MAKAGRKLTPSPGTWTLVRDLEPLVLEICGSRSYCGPWLAKEIAAGRVRWRARAANSPDEPLDGPWQGPIPIIDLKDCTATKLVVAPPGTVVGICSVTLFGLEIVREDVEALRALFSRKEGLEEWVHAEMMRDPPKKGDRGYTRRLWGRRLDKAITLKTVQNLVSVCRKQLKQIPEQVPAPPRKR
jgi:hypothetical protein